MAISRITIISDVDDREVHRVRDRLTPGTYELAGGREAVKLLLLRLAVEPGAARPERSFDLIGHSVDHHFLKIGGWILDESAPMYFENHLRSPLERLRVKQVRLLGCETATSPRSWSVIRGIAARLGGGILVLGTRRLLDERDYSADGFVGVDALAATRGNGPEGHPPLPLDTLCGLTRQSPARHGEDSVRQTEHTCFAGRRAASSRWLA